ncbi:hypothetical protein EJB05_19085 [Eragrostis curvula]|uniref:Uncharacterized protein n=1 Tax=Eragrostis curvula TaxID=38414 RepID=A0A5J9UUQ0_9POAL|nr:hypothetical protein EJB05_19085 [Eragrostis curvula]
MAAAADQPLGFFSGILSRLRAAASGWRRRDDPADEIEEEEATARSRLARRRLGRKLAFVSFNLEVLVFVYAFWRTRRLDLKDKKLIERLQEKKQASDCVLRELDQNEQESGGKYDLMDDPSNFSTAAASAETSKFGTSQQPIVNLRDDGGGDISWDHSKDFQPTCTDGLRWRGSSIEKAYTTSSNAVLQLIGWSTEHLADDPEELDYTQRNVGHHCYLRTEVAVNSMVYSSAEAGTCLPDCSIVDVNSNGMNHAVCSPPPSSLKYNGGLAEENPLQKALTQPNSDLSAFAELLEEGRQENKSSKFHVSEEDGMSFISKKEHFVVSYAVENKEQYLETSSGLALCSQDTDKEDVAGGVCFVKVSPELTLLSSTELVVECSKDASNKESCELNTQDENDVAVNSEEEALLGPHVVSTSEHCCESPGFFLCGQDSNKMEIPAVVNVVAVSTKPNYPAPVESLTHALDDDGSTGDETSNVHLLAQMSQEALVDPLVVDSFEDSFATSKLLSHSEAFKMTEVPGEDLSELLDEGASNHQNDGAIFSEYGGNTDNMIGDSMSVQLIAESNILEAHQGGQEALSVPIHDSSSHSAGIFLSSSEVFDDEAYSSNSNSIFLCTDSMEDKAPVSFQGGPSESKDEMNFAFLDTPILLDEVTSTESWTDNAECSQYIRDNASIKSLHDVNQVPLKTSEISNFGLEESLVSTEEGIKSEIFSLYSRSSSCVSEVNMIETLSGVAFPEPKNDNHFKFD